MRPQPSDVEKRVQLARAAGGARPFLVGFDANGIQELVTASSRPVAMRGASRMVVQFDAWSREHEGSVFGGGGRGLWVVSSADGAERAEQELRARYAKLTHGGVLGCAVVDVTEDAEGDEARALRILRRRLSRAKDEAPPPSVPIASSREDQCDYCKVRRKAHRRQPPGSEAHEVCARCNDAVNQGGREGREKREEGRTLEDLAVGGQLAVVSADGNNMGVLFAGVGSLVQYAAASTVVDYAFRDAHQTALKRALNGEDGISLVTGGDDIRVFIPPTCLLDYVEQLATLLHERAREISNDWRKTLGSELASRLGKVGIGIGAVVAPFHYPAVRLLEYAHEYEVLAKKNCGENWRSAFDFAVLTSGSELSEGTERTRREQEAGWRAIEVPSAAWEERRRRAKALGRVPAAQLAPLRAVRDCEQEEQLNLFRYQVARNREWRQWLGTIGKDWCCRTDVDESLPNEQLVALAALEPRESASTRGNS